MLHSDRLRPHLQILDWGGSVCMCFYVCMCEKREKKIVNVYVFEKELVGIYV